MKAAGIVRRIDDLGRVVIPTEIDREAAETEQRLIARFAASEGVTESLKRRDRMAWVGTMNNIRDWVEEIVLNDLIYA